MIDLVPFGPPAADALLHRIAACKQGDPLAPVTVIVPSNYAGLSIRRSLAARQPLVNVRFQVLARLAELLGGPELVAAGRGPLTPWIRVMGVRAALAENPGVFAEVANHPSTFRELQRTFLELREVSPAALDRVARSGPRARDVVTLYRRYRELTAGYFDEFDLLESATASYAAGSEAAKEAGALIFFLPRRPPGAAIRLFAAAAPTGAHAVLGLTGDPDVDDETRALASHLPGDVTEAQAGVPPVTRIISATDPEEEVREAIRQVMALLAEGMPLHRIAITYATRESYEGLLDDALTSAGIPHNGPPNRKLQQSLAGQVVLGLPKLAGSTGPGDPGFSRDTVMDWLTSAPIHHEGREAPAHRWDEISRDAGVVKGAGQWQSRLELYARNQAAAAADRPEGEREHFERRARWTRSLQAFIRSLAEKVGQDVQKPASEHAAETLKWLKDYLPDHAVTNDTQSESWEAVHDTLQEIANGGGVLPTALNPALDHRAFSIALEDALDQPAGRLGKLGSGAFIGPVSLAAEMSFDAVFILGMVEGSYPSRFAEDPVLSSEDRAQAGGELAMPSVRLREQRRAFLGALHASGQRFLSTPRGDLRAQRPVHPSRWLLAAASSLHGAPLYTTDVEAMLEAPPEWFRVVRSFEAALREPGEPASAQEWDLGSLLRAGSRLPYHFLLRTNGTTNPLARGVEARRSRARIGPSPLDRWRGKVNPANTPVPDAARPISPTALEQYAGCPFRYFLGHVLRVGEVERPEETVTIEPATIGSIVHAILQKFFEGTADRLDPAAPWDAEERAKLHAFTEEVCRDFEARGQTGKSLTWRAEQARIRRDLELLLDRELEERRAGGFRFLRAEAAFGVAPSPERPDPLPPAVLSLPNGRSVAFRGYVDRVDTDSARNLAVIDYKTGSPRSYAAMNEANPLGGGKYLQLPVYALAFRGMSSGPVSARYWFISEQAGFESKQVQLDDATLDRFAGVVETLLDTMGEGYFPAVPGGETWINGDQWDHCRYCPYDLICPAAGRSETWMADQKDPGLAGFVALSDIGGGS
ncbi:MAG: PD-(D/E)XK nuclease family protein [Dehalococcoidia bacterium]|nr:PD-(D/E)XK nuclease family protein [Dehalococcoidia bacterium]